MRIADRWRAALLAWALRLGYHASAALAWAQSVLLYPDRQRYAARRRNRRQAIEPGQAFEVICELQRIATETGAALFPVSGTLLGLHRNGGILAHDVDIDAGLFAWDENLDRFLEAAARSPYCRGITQMRLPSGYRSLNPWLPALEDNVVCHKLAMAQPGTAGEAEIEVDLFVHFRSAGFVVHGIPNRLWLNSEFELEKRQFGTLDILVPVHTVRYLRENYGDFETEKRDFENLVDCPNCVLVNGMSAVFYVSKMRKVYALAGWTSRLAALDGVYRKLLQQLRIGRPSNPDWSIGS